MGARQIEHLNNQGKDIARRSSVSKPDGASPVHSGMVSRTRGSFGGPPNGNPPDASSPRVTDPTRQGKAFPIPKATFGMKSDPERGSFDAALAEAVMNEAHRSPDDFARNLHTVLPSKVQEG
jgi:hypothetical protein